MNGRRISKSPEAPVRSLVLYLTLQSVSNDMVRYSLGPNGTLQMCVSKVIQMTYHNT